MQQDGLASFAQGLHSLVAPLSLQTAAAQERKLANLKAIFSLYVPAVEPVGGPAMQQRPPKKSNPFYKDEEDKDDSMQINDKPMASMSEQLFGPGSNNNMNGGGGAGMMIEADCMDDILSIREKERASTIYKQM